jgi:hypothetical protein
MMTSKYRKQVQPRALNPATIKVMVEGAMADRRGGSGVGR